MEEKKKTSIDDLIRNLNKNYKKQVAFCGNSDIAERLKTKFISTGSLAIDIAVGNGGLPLGRVVSIAGEFSSGKSSCALTLIASAQRQGYTAAYIDVEKSFSPEYAKALGVDLDKLLYVSPDYGEEACNQCFDIADSGAVQVIVLDSLAALVPNVEQNSSIEDQQMGLQARMLGKFFRRIVPTLESKQVLLFCINQLREKIGVMFGDNCIEGKELIQFEDGTIKTIKEIVDNKIQGKIRSYNEKTKEIEYKPISKWFYNGKIDSIKNWNNVFFNKIEDGSKGGNTKIKFSCTDNHKILTSQGWKYIYENPTDILQIYDSIEFDGLAGMLIGDSTLRKCGNSASICLHNELQTDYQQWKFELFKDALSLHKSSEKNICESKKNEYLSNYFNCLGDLYDKLNFKYKRNPLFMLNEENFSLLNLAIWYMDNGYYDNSKNHNRCEISVKRIKDGDTLKEIIDFLSKKGFKCSYSLKRGKINFNVEETEILHKAIAPYIPECMNYKINSKYWKESNGKNIDIHLNKIKKTKFVPILKIEKNKSHLTRGKYDLEVEDNHNYFLGKDNGVLVHNSYEVGGNAIKYAATIQMRIMRSMAAKDGKILNESGDIIGNRHKVKVVKNKISAPFTEAIFNIMYGKGIDRISEIFNIGVEHNIIEKAGSFYSYDGMKLGQGEANTLAFLRENVDITKKIMSHIQRDIKRIEEETKRKALEVAVINENLDSDSIDDLDSVEIENNSNNNSISSLTEEKITSTISHNTGNQEIEEMANMIKRVEEAVNSGKLSKSGPFIQLTPDKKLMGSKACAKWILENHREDILS